MTDIPCWNDAAHHGERSLHHGYGRLPPPGHAGEYNFTGDRISVGESVVHFSESLAVVEGCCLIPGACGGTIIMAAPT